MLKLFVALQTQLAGLMNRDDRGATAVEYGLLVGLIAAIIIVAVTLLGKQVSHAFDNVTAALTTAGL